MLIAQITDLHLGAKHGDPAYSNEARTDAVLAHVAAMTPAPDLLLVTGDLTESGDLTSYEAVAARLDGIGFPVLLAIGNHDERDNFRTVFPDIAEPGDFIHYVRDAGPLRVIVLDSVEIGRHGGSFCEARARWLAERLDEQPDRPTLIVVHHPPIETGIGWMTIAPDEPWVDRLANTLAGRTNVVAVLSGHLHRPIVANWGDQHVVVCPSVAPPVALELAPIDPDAPDGRPLILDGPPSYALHLWMGERLVTHFQTADDQTAVLRFDNAVGSVIAKLVNEPPSD